MSNRNWRTGWIVGVLLAVCAAAIAAPPACPIPLEVGAKWVYAGRAEWAESGKDGSTERLNWTAEVIRAERKGDAVVAVFRDFPTCSAWYSPGQAERFSVALYRGGRFLLREAESRKEAMRIANGAPGQWDAAITPMLEMPLRKGRRIGLDSPRSDTRYCWYVQSVGGAAPTVHGAPKGVGPLVRMVYVTNPDRQEMDLAAGLGIVRYKYHHNGTTAVTDLRLVSFTPGRLR